MADDQDRLQARGSGAAISRHQIALAVVRAQNFDVLRVRIRPRAAARHRVGRYCRAANRIRRVDFDELLENVMRQFAGRVHRAARRPIGPGLERLQLSS